MARNHIEVAVQQGIEAGFDTYFENLSRLHPDKAKDWPKRRDHRLNRYKRTFGEKIAAYQPSVQAGKQAAGTPDLAALMAMMQQMIAGQTTPEPEPEPEPEPDLMAQMQALMAQIQGQEQGNDEAEPDEPVFEAVVKGAKQVTKDVSDSVSISRGLVYWFLYRAAECGFTRAEIPLNQELAQAMRATQANPYVEGWLRGSK